MTSQSETFSVLAEETIAKCLPFNNGSGPLWAFGSRVIARDGQDIWASVPEVNPADKPLCNVRYTLVQRNTAGQWRQIHRAERPTEREPCPLVRLPNGKIVLSIQPCIHAHVTRDDGAQAYYCQPTLMVFDAAKLDQPPQSILPKWDQPYEFTEHSYRAFAADPQTGRVFFTDQLSIDNQHPHAWTFMDADLKPIAQGQLWFPMRGCYQQIAVRNNAVYIMAVSDEIEPMTEWRNFKKQVTGKDWDYDFRQLFFTWTPDITTTPLSSPLTVATCDETAGLIRNLDLTLDAQGDAWLLYTERNVWHAFFRDKFFPTMPLRTALRLARVRKGRVIERHTLIEAHENTAATVPGGHNLDGITFDGPYADWAAFHACPDGRLFALWYQIDADQKSANCIRQVLPTLGPVKRIPLSEPLQTFQPACQRNGCLPADIIDLYGLCRDAQTIRYVQLSVGSDPK